MSDVQIAERHELSPMSGWDRTAIILLGAAGFAFSYDALRQVALAIHARPSLSYLFPVFIDGFIAYGVRALVLLRHGGFGARLYVWVLFLAATGASLWANALHAITLNHGPLSGPAPLHLGDRVVGVLSMLAPLALAGSVHLYILMARTAESSVPDGPVSRPGPVPELRIASAPATRRRRMTALGAGLRKRLNRRSAPVRPQGNGRAHSPADQPGPVQAKSDKAIPVHPAVAENESSAGRDHDGGRPDGRPGPPVREGEEASAAVPATYGAEEEKTPSVKMPDEARGEDQPSVPDGTEAVPGREAVDDWMQQLLPIAQEASRQAGRISRSVVQEAVRAKQPISNDRLGELISFLKKEEERATARGKERAPANASSRLW